MNPATMNPPAAAAAPVWPGYAVPGSWYPAPPVRHTSHLRMFVILGIALVVMAAVMVAVSRLITPPTPHYQCPPDCGGPPIGAPLQPPGVVPPPGVPVQSFARFTPNSGQYSVAYPSGITVPPDANGVKWGYKDGGKASLFGQPAGNQTPRDIAQGLIEANYPGAQLAYEIPNAMVGYQPGYGEIDDFYPQVPTSSATRWRVLVMVAVKSDFALIATATGPYQEVTPDTDGHPSGANFAEAFDISDFVNRFMWQGDPPR
jgi:hypothetical protein